MMVVFGSLAFISWAYLNILAQLNYLICSVSGAVLGLKTVL